MSLAIRGKTLIRLLRVGGAIFIVWGFLAIIYDCIPINPYLFGVCMILLGLLQFHMEGRIVPPTDDEYVTHFDKSKHTGIQLALDDLYNMDGQKVWCASIYDGEETPDDFDGIYRVDVAAAKLVELGSSSFYDFDDIDDACGFNAYRLSN